MKHESIRVFFIKNEKKKKKERKKERKKESKYFYASRNNKGVVFFLSPSAHTFFLIDAADVKYIMPHTCRRKIVKHLFLVICAEAHSSFASNQSQ